MIKFQKRCAAWSLLPLGAQLASRCYRIFCFSTLTFVSQLALVREKETLTEAKMLRRVMPGPGTWFQTSDLFSLQTWFKSPIIFPSLEVVARAAKLRTMNSLCERYDFPKLARRMDEIHVNNLDSPYQGWLKNSFVQILRDNLEHCSRVGISLSRVKGVIRDRLGSRNPEFQNGN